MNKKKIDNYMNYAYIIFSNIIRLIFVYEIIYNIFFKEYNQMLIALMGFIGTFAPFIIKKIFKIQLPKTLNFIIVLFVFCTQYLGSLKNVYDSIKSFDTILHLTSGALICVIGIYGFLQKGAYDITQSNCIVSMFGFCFSEAAAVFWEIYEFASDKLLGTNMQLSKEIGNIGLMDTMVDLIAGSSGAMIAALGVYIYLNKRNKKVIIDDKKENLLKV